jgi:hypothetical protein
LQAGAIVIARARTTAVVQGTGERGDTRATAQLIYTIVAAAAAVVLLLLTPDEVGAAAALVVVAAAAVLAAALFPPGHDRSDFGDALFLASLPFVLGFGVRTILSLAEFVPVNSVGVLVADPFEFEFDAKSLEALALSVLSWGLLFGGYRLRLGEAISAKLPNPSLAGVAPGSVAATVVLAVVGWAARIASMAQGGTLDASSGLESINSISTLLLWLSFLTTAASTIALFVVFFQGASLRNVLLAVALVTGEVVAGLITGSRTLVLTPLVGAAAMAYLTGRYRLRLRHILVLPALLLVLGVTDTYRNPGLVSGSIVDTADTGARARVALEESIDQGPVDLAARGALNVALRYHGLYSVAQILRVGPPSDLSYGTAYVAAVPAALVPRFLWPGKPFPTYGVDFGREYFGVPESVGVSIAPTWIGDLLLNVPIVLAPIGMGILGVVLRAFRGYGLRGRDGDTFAVLVYPALLPIVVQTDGWISGAVWEATQAVAVLAAAFLLMRSLARVRVAPRTAFG